MTEQGRKLMTTLGLVIKRLKKLDAILPAVREMEQLGRKAVALDQFDAEAHVVLGAQCAYSERGGRGHHTNLCLISECLLG